MAQPHPNPAYGRVQGPSVTAPPSPYQEDDARGGEAETFARAVIFTICSIGVPAHQARRTYERCMAALVQGGTARMGFRNPSRADAIDAIWRERVRFHRGYRAAEDRVAWLETLPGIGPVMKHRLKVALDLFEESDLARDATTEERTGVVTNAS
jgi:hypothetical protein